MMGDILLMIYCDVVWFEWVDYNGYLCDVFYLLIFSFVIDVLLDCIGFDDVVCCEWGCLVYMFEVYVNYLYEIKEGVLVCVDVCVLVYDVKWLYLYFELFVDGYDDVVLVSE